MVNTLLRCNCFINLLAFITWSYLLESPGIMAIIGLTINNSKLVMQALNIDLKLIIIFDTLLVVIHLAKIVEEDFQPKIKLMILIDLESLIAQSNTK